MKFNYKGAYYTVLGGIIGGCLVDLLGYTFTPWSMLFVFVASILIELIDGYIHRK